MYTKYRKAPSTWASVARTACAIGVAAAAFTAPSTAEAAGMLIAEGGLGGRLNIIEHTVDVTINNGIAVTEVTQIFENQEDRQVEALYTFPVPNGASVSNFSMWINGKEMIGEVVEKKRAREIYDSYKRQRIDPGLLEQVDFKQFEMRIFPIAPLGEQKVQVKYYQELGVDHDWVNYVYPLATNTKGAVDEIVQGKFAFTMRVKSEVPIVEMKSASHANDFIFATQAANYAETSLEMTEGSLSRDIVLAYHTSRPHTGIDVVTSANGNEDGYFYLTLTPGEELAETGPAMDYLFILDISGSMANSGKLALSSESIAAFVDALHPDARFDVLTFNIQPTPLFGELRDVTDESRDRARKFVSNQSARGGTVLQSALRAAYNYADPNGDRMLNLVILSDGLTQNDDQRALLDASGERPDNARVFCIGVGNEVNRPVLNQLAAEAGGLAAFISVDDDFERQAQAFQRKLIRPVATDIRIEIEGAETYDIVPATLPNLYHGMPMRVFGRYKNPGDAQVIVRGFVEGQSFEQRIAYTFPERDGDNPEIERMWASKSIAEIMDTARRNTQGELGGADVSEIVRLGEGYSIVSEYTSFLVLENEGEYARWKIERRNALRENRDRTAQEKFKKELDTMRERASADVGPNSRQKMAKNDTDNKSIESKKKDTFSNPEWHNTENDAPSRDVNISSPGLIRGGGAFDPVSGGICLLLAGSCLITRKKSH